MDKKRASNFELLRILCIFGIITMHTFSRIDISGSVPNTLWNVFCDSIFNTGVTCFVLLSGYFGIRFDLQKLIRLDLMVIFFTVLGTVVIGDLGIKSLIKACIPVLSRRYWFITCYFALCFLAPFLNRAAEKMTQAYFRRLLLALLFLFSIVPTFGFYDITMEAGKGIVNFILSYLIGRYLFFYHQKQDSSARLLTGIAVSILCIFVADGFLSLHQGVLYMTFSRDCSLFIIFAAVLLVLLFRNFSFQSAIINRAAGDVLAVYVLDEFIRTFFNRYVSLNDYRDAWYFILIVFAYVLVVMLTAILINEVRRLTVGRLEPWLGRVIASIIMWFVNRFARFAHLDLGSE